jgi:outer membrane protein
VAIPNLENFEEVSGLVSPEALYLSALEIMPEIKSSQFALYSAEKSTEIARGSYYPSLTLSGSYGTGFSGANRRINPNTGNFTDVPFTDQLDQNQNYSISFRLTIPIFNKFSTRIGVRQALLQEKNASLIYENTKLQLKQNIESAHVDAVAALKRYKAAEKSVAALTTSFDYTQERFNVGMINSFDFNNEKNRLANSQSELLQAKYNYIFSTKVLDFYRGKAFTFNQK